MTGADHALFEFMNRIKLKRAYEQPGTGDGFRILVERLWPRGLARDRARIDLWLRDVAPSTQLRKWFSHDPERWNEFKIRYHEELRGQSEALDLIREKVRAGQVTFVFGSREVKFNNAVALREFLGQKLGRDSDNS